MNVLQLLPATLASHCLERSASSLADMTVSANVMTASHIASDSNMRGMKSNSSRSPIR